MTIGEASSHPAQGLNDPLGHLVDPRDPAEDVDEDGLHRRVGVDDLEGGCHHVGVGASADVEEVGGLTTDLGDDVEGLMARPAPLAMMPTVPDSPM